MKKSTLICFVIVSLMLFLIFTLRKSVVRSLAEKTEHSASPAETNTTYQLSSWFENNEILGAGLALQGIVQ